MTPNPDFSYCVVWSPLWPITLFFPFIGHTGIADSHGIANDFQGSYFVGTEGDMAFGPATRYWKVPREDGEISAEQWDEAIHEANRIYNGRIHNICCDNCHSHVCCALNQHYLNGNKKYGQWNMVKLCLVMFFQAKFVSVGAILCQFVPFTILVLLVAVLSTTTK